MGKRDAARDCESVGETRVSADEPAPVGDEARGALAISIGQAALMAAGGLLALLITQFFGKGAGTDAFFTAYGLYTIAVAFAQTLRLTALPRLMGDVTGEEESRLPAAVIGLSLVAALPLVVLAEPFGRLIANGDPTGLAAETLRLFWPALVLHLIAGVMVPMLILRRIFVPIGVAFASSSIVGVAGFVLLQPELGIKAVPVSLTLGAAMLAAALTLRLRDAGWRPRARLFLGARSIAGGAGTLVVSSASFLVTNLGYLICLAVANHEPLGSATNYAYSFFAAVFFVACTAIPSAMVRAPRLLDDASGPGVTETDVMRDFRPALVVLAFCFGFFAVVTAPVARLVAGDFFSADDAWLLVSIMLSLAPWVLASVAGVLVVLQSLNRGRAGALATIAATQMATLIPLAIAGRLAFGVVGIALAQSAAMCLATAAQLRLAFGARSFALARNLTSEVLRATLIAVFAFGPAGLALTLFSDLAGIVLAFGGAIAYAMTVKRLYAAEWRLIESLVSGRYR